ncbi:MAG TPA: DUF4082 domain-containing protein, partial [Candidatus Polarisedimenticolaceae bacterium]|nr:DUF4082 domain-containing protein [Candidatus Polarisedimenticolaceae bacterium]
NVGVGIQGPDGFHENLEITNNVIHAVESQPGITVGGIRDGLIAHNTTNRFIKSVISSQNDPTVDTTFRDNIASGFDYPSDSQSVPTGGNVVSNNIIFSTAEFSGCTPTGCIPSAWAGYELDSGSPGKGDASDNSGDIGMQVFAPGDALPSIDDTTAPSAPANLTAGSYSVGQVNLNWSASTDNFQTVGYKIFRGGTQVGTSLTTSYADMGVSAGTGYSYTVRAYDATGNTSGNSSSASITTPQTSALWGNDVTPATVNANDSSGIEVGVKFKSDVAGSVQAIRFYKGSQNTGTHVGHLWSASGAQLASVTFTGETSSGWQEAALSQPVNIDANTVYVVSYYAPNGNYSANGAYFDQTYTSTPLHAPADGTNGMYLYGGGFPTNSFNNTNYWVDIRFDTEVIGPDTEVPSAPSNLAAQEYMTQANLSWSASTDNIGVTGYQVYRGGTLIATTTATTYVDTGVVPGVSYSYTVKAIDEAENLSAVSSAASVTIPISATIWTNSATPANPNVADSAIEVGTQFRTSTAGSVTAIRFYKGASNTGTHVGHLWTSGGTQLVSVTFTGESSSGWQEAVLDTPVSLSANTTYVVSYYAPNGNYAATG